MDKKGNTRNRQWSPVIVAVVIVFAGMIANLLLFAQYAGPKTIGDEFEKVRGDMGFVKWSSVYEMEDIEPNTLFAIVSGRIVGRFQFQSDSYRTLLSAGINDNAQRPWINVDHSEGTYHVNCYPKGDGNVLTEPTLTFVDTDGDGLTDRKVDWLNKKTYDATGPLSWSLLEPASKSSKP